MTFFRGALIPSGIRELWIATSTQSTIKPTSRLFLREGAFGIEPVGLLLEPSLGLG